tara:strand:- start:1264 stop:1995 length:732 start_codon:yes stop_codon:yes gene_type:complete
MTLTVTNKSNFLSYFLNPVSRLSNSCIVNIGNEDISTIIAAADNTSILYARYKTNLGESGNKINLPDLSRLNKILQCIEADKFKLELDRNCIRYKDLNIQFKYHLLEDDILTSPPISTDKIAGLTFNTNFKVPYSSILNLIKTSTFALNLNKLYFFTKDGNVYAEINDKQSHNVDSVCIKLCEGYSGEDIKDPLPLSFETIRTIVGAKCEYITINVNSQLNVMTFDINNSESNLTYIVSGLIK